MRPTGVVRRIDELGRIVVPKEIRRTMRIKEGDPLEIFVGQEGAISLKKYSPILELKEFAQSYAESLSQILGELVIITDKDCVIAACGAGKKDFIDKSVSSSLEFFMEQRGSLVCSKEETSFFAITENDTASFAWEGVTTILTNGDCIGSVTIYGEDIRKYHPEALRPLLLTAALFLGKQME